MCGVYQLCCALNITVLISFGDCTMCGVYRLCCALNITVLISFGDCSMCGVYRLCCTLNVTVLISFGDFSKHNVYRFCCALNIKMLRIIVIVAVAELGLPNFPLPCFTVFVTYVCCLIETAVSPLGLLSPVSSRTTIHLPKGYPCLYHPNLYQVSRFPKLPLLQ